MMYSKYEVYKVTEYKDGAVYKTKLLKTIWLTPYESDKWDGDILSPTGEIVFQWDKPTW